MDDLLTAIREGDERTLQREITRLRPALLRVARYYVRDPAVAEEVVQEAWLRALEGLDRFEGRSAFKTWLHRILMNVARSRGKRDARVVPFSDLAGAEVADEDTGLPQRYFQGAGDPYPGHWTAGGPGDWGRAGSDPEREVLDAEALDLVEGAVETLPEVQRMVITLRDVFGWSSSEVCNALDISESNQRVLLHRARTKVRRTLADYFEDEKATDEDRE